MGGRPYTRRRIDVALSERMANKTTILFKAIRHGDLVQVSAMLERHPELVRAYAIHPPRKDDGQSPLQMAIKTGKHDNARARAFPPFPPRSAWLPGAGLPEAPDSAPRPSPPGSTGRQERSCRGADA
jgi:hypothetical protein